VGSSVGLDVVNNRKFHESFVVLTVVTMMIIVFWEGGGSRCLQNIGYRLHGVINQTTVTFEKESMAQVDYTSFMLGFQSKIKVKL
jgi:hypothetical protein